MKRIGIILGIILILAFLAAILAPFLIDLNRYKETILTQIAPYVPREVDFEHIELTVLSGLGAELRGLRVADNPAFSSEDFLQLEGLQIKVQALPLLRRQIKVKKIILKRPVVRLARNGAGEFSFSDLLTNGEKSAAGEEGRPAEETLVQEEVGGGLGLLAGLLVNELAIQKGSIVYEDALLWPGDGPLVIDALDMDVRDLSFDRPVSIQLAAKLMGESDQNFDLGGTVGPVGKEILLEEIPFSIRTSLRALSIERLMDLLPEDLPMRLRSGTVSARWEASGSLDQKIVSEAEVDLKDLRWEAAGEEVGGPEPGLLHCTITEKLVLEYAAEKFLLESMDVSVNGEHLRMQGTVEGFAADPRWDLKVWSESFRTDLLVANLPMIAEAIPEELAFEGPVSIRFESAGTREAFKMEARVDLEGMRIQVQDMFQKPPGGKFSIGCKADKRGEHVTLNDLELLLHTLALNASGELVLSETPHFGILLQTNPIALEGWGALCPMLSPYQPKGSFFLRSSLRGTLDDASVNLEVSSDKIGFRLPPAEGADGAGADGVGLLESCNIKVQAKKKSTKLLGLAQAEIKKGEVLKVPFERLLASLRYSPDVLEIEGLEMKVFQGNVQGTGSYDLAKESWDFKPRVTGVAVGEVLDRLTEYKEDFSGTFRGQFAVNGSTRPGPKPAVNAEGSFRISQGELKNFDLVGSVMDTLFGVKGVGRGLSASRKEIREHESTRFDWLEGAFELKQEVLFLNDLRLRNIGTSKATDSDALLEGKVFLEKQLLDMKGKVILSKRHSDELARQAEVLKALYNAEERIVLPITLKGKTQKPVAFLDTEYVLGAISRYYTRQGVEELQKKLGWPEQKEDGEETPGERLLRELFKKR